MIEKNQMEDKIDKISKSLARLSLVEKKSTEEKEPSPFYSY